MTHKLFYEDAYIREAEVRVVSGGKDCNGFYVILDRTCFYPEGGGQPSDTGRIGNVPVHSVQSVDGEIRHYVDALPGEGVYMAEIDWHRRFDHMQQHAGQHILSAVLEDYFGCRTVSFHLGREGVSIDLDTPALADHLLRGVERLANDIVRRHLPIGTEWIDEQEAQSRKLRKPPAVSSDIRVANIPGIDSNACGGTHPANTADVGLIKLLGTEKAKGGTRLYFLCGNRAIDYFTRQTEMTDRLIHKLNAPGEALVEAVDTLLAERTAADKKIKALNGQLIGWEAAALEAEDGMIIRKFNGRPLQELQQLAKTAVASRPEVALFFESVEAGQVKAVCAKGSQAPGDMAAVLKRLLAAIGGKGGGNQAFAQGGGAIPAEEMDLAVLFKEYVRKPEEGM